MCGRLLLASHSSLQLVTPTDCNSLLAGYRKPSVAVSVRQLATSIGPYLAIWVLMALSLRWSYLLALALALPAAAFLVRIFILQHDCGHRSFFQSKRANDLVGFVLGVITFTPYHTWRRLHAMHHATSGNLDRRGNGDINTMTVTEYLQLGRLRRLAYRLYRNPLVLFGVGGFWHFVVLQRLTYWMPRCWKRERASVHWTNLGLLVLCGSLGWLLGPWQFLLVQIAVLLPASSIGVWLFYVQHQFEETYWQRSAEWDYVGANIEGSSYYHLPKILQWFTANIGLHHIHHLDSRIPNYRLQKCFDENAHLQQVTRLTLLSSLSCASLKLWDEERRKLVSFKSIKRVATAR